MSNAFGVPGESARQQAERRRRELERLQRQEHSWDGGALGEEGTAEAIEKRCPGAVALHDRRMPESRANIDHIVLVPSGVWVIDSKRMTGRIKVENANDGTQKLIIKDRDQTELVHKLTWQLNAVKAAMAEIDATVPVYAAFCFWLAIDHTRDLFNPFVEDNGLPLLRTLTINGYPLFIPRQMTRKLNSAGTLSPRRAQELASRLAERFPSAASSNGSPRRGRTARPVGAGTDVPPATPPMPSVISSPVVPPMPSVTPPDEGRVSKQEFKAAKEAEHQRAWEQQRPMVEAALGCAVPGLLSERLSTDGAVWCHPTLWHSRVYLGCVHGKVGQSFSYRQAASVVAAHQDGRPGPRQWRALSGFLEHLRFYGYVAFDASPDGRVDDVLVTADLKQRPA